MYPFIGKFATLALSLEGEGVLAAGGGGDMKSDRGKKKKWFKKEEKVPVEL